MRVAIANPVVSLDPQDSLDFSSLLVQAQLFETPYVLDEDHRPGPALLSELPSLESGADATYRAPIREGIKFANGTPLEAGDIVRSLSRSPLVANRMAVSRDGDDVVFELEEPDAALAAELSKPWCAVTLEHEPGPLGTGPYMLDASSTADRLVLVRNPEFRGLRPRIASIEVRAYPDPAALANALSAGEVDFTTALPLDRAEGVTGMRKLFRPGSGTALLWFNTRRLRSPTQRQAIAQTIDRHALGSHSYSQPAAFIGRCVLPSRMAAFTDGVRFGPRNARELLEASEQSLPSTLRMIVIWGPRPYLPDPSGWADLIARDLRELGVALEIVHSTDAHDYQDRLRSGDYDLVLGGWNADTDDPYDFLDALFSSTMIPSPDQQLAAGCNFARWSDPTVERMILRYRDTRRPEVLEAVLQRTTEEMPVFALAYSATIVVHARWLSGFDVGALGIPQFAQLGID